VSQHRLGLKVQPLGASRSLKGDRSLFHKVGLSVKKGPWVLSQVQFTPKNWRTTVSSVPWSRRLVVSISRSSGNAVRRNRVRRIVREFVQRNATQIEQSVTAKNGVWLRFSARQKIPPKISSRSVVPLLKELFGQLGLLPHSSDSTGGRSNPS